MQGAGRLGLNPLARISVGLQKIRYRLVGGARPCPHYGAVGKTLPDGDVMLGDIRAHTLPLPPAHSDAIMDVAARDRPVPLIMVHGMAQKADSTWYNYKNFFCSNPHNGWGGTYSTATEQQFIDRLRAFPQARVFAIDLSDNIAPPDEMAPELKRLIDIVKRETGFDQVDLLTHSMGGLVTREYFHQDGDPVRKVAMLAPPNHGSGDADLAHGLHLSGVYSHYPAKSMKVLKALKTQRNRFGFIRNKYLENLHLAWKNGDWKKAQQTYIITGAGVPTPAGFLAMRSGDGMVVAESAWLEHAEFYIAQPHGLVAGTPEFRDFEELRYNHLNILSDPPVMHLVDNLLS